MRVLVTGAAGYIGSHVARALEESGHEAVRLDDLSTGHESLAAGRPLLRVSLHDRRRLAQALRGCEAVAHLAGSALVPESVAKPELYWRNNLGAGLSLVEEMLGQGIPRLVFSSTCAVYGVPANVPIDEDAPHAPVSPYGASKAAFERVLADVGAAHDLRSISFRFFNAAGAHEAGDIGEIHDPETHLIPIVLDVAAGRREALTIHGSDYDTPDGTCVRDYVDVRDIARAHVVALEALESGRSTGGTFNLGHGRGHSVLEVVRACEAVTGRRIPFENGPRRPGDPPRLIASVDRVRHALGWSARHDLPAMVETAWRFANGRPPGGTDGVPADPRGAA